MYGNSQRILDLDRGRLTGWKRVAEEQQTTRRYKDKKGQSRYIGTKNLKKTERPSLVKYINLKWIYERDIPSTWLLSLAYSR